MIFQFPPKRRQKKRPFLILCLRNQESSKEQGISLLTQYSCCRALLNYNSHVKNSESKKQSFRICPPIIIDLKMIKEYQYKRNKFLHTCFTILSVWARQVEKQNLFHEDQLKMNLQANIQKIQTFRKAAAILNDVKYSICSSLDFEYRL